MTRNRSQLTYPAPVQNAKIEKEIAYFTSLDAAGMERELTKRATEVRDKVIAVEAIVAPIFARVSKLRSDDQSKCTSPDKWDRIFNCAISFSYFLCVFVSMLLKHSRDCATEVLSVPFKSIWSQSLPRRYIEFSNLLSIMKEEEGAFEFLIEEQLNINEHEGIEFAYAMVPTKAFDVFQTLHRFQIQDLCRAKGVQTTGIASLAKVKRLAGVVKHLEDRTASLEKDVFSYMDSLESPKRTSMEIMDLYSRNYDAFAMKVEGASKKYGKKWIDKLTIDLDRYMKRATKIAEIRDEVKLHREMIGEA